MTAPSHRSLEDLAVSVDYGFTAAANAGEVGPQFLRITDIQDDQVDWSTVPFCKATPAEEAAARLEPGDIVFARTGATTGKSYLLRSCPERAVFASYLIRVRPNLNQVDPRYLSWYFQTPEYWRQISSSASGTAQPGVNATKLKSLSVPTPPLADQRRIADILDKADTIRRKRKEAIALTEELSRSAFLKMFGDPLANPKGWPVKPIAAVGKVTTGGTPPSSGTGMFDGEVPFVTPGDLESDQPVKRRLTEKGAAESRTVRAGAALVCCIGATIGKIGKTRERSAFNQQINAVEWSAGVDDDFGFALLRFYKRRIADSAASTTMPILKKSSFERLGVPIPPFAAQQEFAQWVRGAERLRDHGRASLHVVDALRWSLMQRAFRGDFGSG